MTGDLNSHDVSLPVRGRRLTPLRLGLAIAAIAVYWGALRGTEFSLAEIASGLPAVRDLVVQMFPPDWSYLARLGDPVVETLQIGILATVITSVLSVPLGFLAARNLTPHPYVYLPVRLFLTVCRGVSEIIWALLFVVAVGLGPFAGVLALVIFCIGVMAKLLAEALEAADPGPLDAMRACGAGRWKVFWYGCWPQVFPLHLSYCLYYWDHNTRQAVVLGFVGAGGVGYSLFFAISTYEFERATMALIVLIAMIAVIDRISLFLRKRVI